MLTQNSLSSQLASINLFQENGVKLSNAYLEAITTAKANVTVQLEAIDGSQVTVTIPSNTFLNNELARLSQSFKNLVGLTQDGRARLIHTEDNSFQQIMLSSYSQSLRQANDADITVNNQISVESNAIIENLLSPLTEVEFKLASDFIHAKSAVINKIVLEEGDISLFSNGMTHGQVLQMLAQNDTKWKEYEYVKNVPTRTPRYFGEFIASESQINSSNQLVLTLDTLNYSDSLNIVSNSRQLEPGDKLVNSNGSLLLEVISINTAVSTCTLQFISGVGSVLAGDIVYFRSKDLAEASVKVPVRMNERSICFIQMIDPITGYAAPKSTAKIFNSDEFIVVENGTASTFNEYFASKVADVGRYFEAIIKENTIPTTLGIKPVKPTLFTDNFNVVQINQHLTNTPNASKVQKLQKEKDVANSQLGIINAAIAELNTKIAKGNYSTEAKKSADVALRQNKINEKLQKTQLLSSIVADLNTTLGNTAEQTITPKYKVRGFWQVQQDMPSEFTNPQKIVQYQIRHRYVSNNGNTANSTQMTYRSDEDKISAVFTPWTFTKTEPLERTVDVDGNVIWQDNVPNDADASNINQLDIPIQYGESVEFQVRAISEAGWPTSPISSDWSELIRVDFPQSLLQESDLASIARRNADDAITVKLLQEFASQGVTEHISKSFKEQEKYYAHELKDIASGKVTSDQKQQISALEYVEQLESKVRILEEIVNRRFANATLQIVDENLRTYDVNHFSTVKLFAGYYTDEVDLTVDSNKGSIVEKTFYLKIINRNSQTIELLSISPGPLTQSAASSQYADVPLVLTGTNSISSQLNGQIFYNRLQDINGIVELYTDPVAEADTTIPSADINTSAAESIKNIVHIPGGVAEIVKLVDQPSLENCVAFTTNHPSYQAYLANSSDISILYEEFERIKWFNDSYKAANVQTKLNEHLLLSYSASDKWLIGQKTVGSMLFTALKGTEAYQVNGIDTSSAKEIYSGEQDSILIPIIFQYRMTDALGFPNGQSNLSQNTNFEYSKKIGFDFLLSGKKFTFDVQVSAKFRPSSTSNNNIGIQTTSSIITEPNVN